MSMKSILQFSTAFDCNILCPVPPLYLVKLKVVRVEGIEPSNVTLDDVKYVIVAVASLPAAVVFGIVPFIIASLPFLIQ